MLRVPSPDRQRRRRFAFGHCVSSSADLPISRGAVCVLGLCRALIRSQVTHLFLDVNSILSSLHLFSCSVFDLMS